MQENLVFGVIQLVTVTLWMAALMAVGSVLVAAALPRLVDDARRLLRRQVGWAVLWGMVLAPVFLVGQALLLEGRLGWPDPTLLAMVVDSPQGLRSALLFAGFVLLGLSVGPWFGSGFGFRWNARISPAGAAEPGHRVREGLQVATALIGVVLILVAFTRTGHTVREPRLLLVVLLFVHLALAAFWLASLRPLHRALANTPPDIASLRRFGGIAGIAVVGLVAAGGVLIWQLSGDPTRILASEWGRWLLVKLALVAGLLGLAALNRWRWVPALAGSDPVRARRALAVSIGVEMLAFVLILGVTAGLISTPPPVA